MKRITGFYYTALLLIAVLTSPAALSQVRSVQATPAVQTLDVSRGLNILVNWSVTFGGSDAVSRRGEFLGSRGVLLANPTVLQLSLPRGANGSVSLSQREPLTVSAALAQRWWSQGLRRVVYRRDFSAGSGMEQGASITINLVNTGAPNEQPPPINPPPPTPPPTPPPMQPQPPTPVPPNVPPGSPGPTDPIPPTSPPERPPVIEPPSTTPQSVERREPRAGLGALRDSQTSAVTLTRLELAFEDLSVVSFVDQNTPLKARLRISYLGTGLLRGRWMLAGPTSTVGTPVFATLQAVNQPLTRSQRTDIMSPSLPTHVPGRYYLAFCADLDIDTQARADLPLLDFCPGGLISTTVGFEVFPESKRATIAIATKPPIGPVTAATEFLWTPVPGTALYQIQFMASEKPASGNTESQGLLNDELSAFAGGMIVPAKTQSTVLSEGLLTLLRHRERYAWRITAYDDSGRILGASRIEQRLFEQVESGRVGQ